MTKSTLQFPSDDAFRALRKQPAIWLALLERVLDRSPLGRPTGDPISGMAGTYPTFIWGDLVIKLFGHLPNAQTSFDAEIAIYHHLETLPELKVPKLLASGMLFPDEEASWPYLVLSRMAGDMWVRADLNGYDKCRIARALGEQIGRLHRSDTGHIAKAGAIPHQSAFDPLDFVEACSRSLLPCHLLEEVPEFMTRFDTIDPVLVHGDLMERHAFVAEGRLKGVIDWGDGMIADRHYELAKLHLGMFEGQPGLLHAFLDGADWPLAPDFAQQALAHCIWRQAIGLQQHPGSFDAFHRIGQIIAKPEGVKSLDELAERLFGLR